MARYVERSTHDKWGTVWRLAVLVVLMLTAILVVYPWRGLYVTGAMVLLSLWLWVRLMSGRTGYRCASCGKVFQVPTGVNFFTMSSMGKNRDGTYYSAKSLTCPHCGKRTKARLVKRVEAAMARGSGRILK